MSKIQAEQYLKNKNSILPKAQISKLEKLGKTTKKIKDQVSMENAGKVFGSLVSPKKRKKQLNEMSKEELINEVAETKFKSLSTKQLIGGCIGIFGYIIVKAIGGWGWHYGDIIGLFLLANSSGLMTFVSATVFAIGVCYFWPTMLSFVSEKIPESGALGLSLMGGAGMLSVSFVLPQMGKLMDENVTGSEALMIMGYIPAVLIVAFTLLHFYVKAKKI